MQRNQIGIPLILAAKSGTPSAVQQLLELKAEVDTRDSAGFTALMMAAAQGHIECLNLLLQANANPDIINNAKRTALDFAAFNGNTLCVKALIEKTSDDHALNKALGIAAYRHQIDCIKVLLAAKANINSQDYTGKTPLLQVLYGEDSDENIPECVQILLEAKPDLEIADRQDVTPLLLAATSLNPHLVRLLLLAGAKTNAGDKPAVLDQFLQVMEDEKFKNPSKCLPIIRLLIQAGATLRKPQKIKPLLQDKKNQDVIFCEAFLKKQSQCINTSKEAKEAMGFFKTSVKSGDISGSLKSTLRSWLSY